MIGKKAEPYLLLLPAVALALMFSILPFMRTVFLSFMKVTQGGDVIGFGGLSSYKSLFADKAFIRSIGHTLLFVLLFIPLNTALTLLSEYTSLTALTLYPKMHSQLPDFTLAFDDGQSVTLKEGDTVDAALEGRQLQPLLLK